MTPDVLYTTIIASLSIGFFGASVLISIVFIEDSARYYIPGFVLLSIISTFIVETLFFGLPPLAFAPLQVIAIPIGSVTAFGLYFYIVNLYTKAKSPY